VTTDAGGRFSMPLPPGTSRELQVGYAGSPRFSAARPDEMELAVEGGARFRSSERRARVGERFRFSGRVKHLGARVPERGKLVELQVKRPEGWDTVRQAFRTDGDGNWRFPFRFGDYYVKPTSFRFRLKVPHEGGWPYANATTTARRITAVPKR
jgi:hypothetical protein